MHVLMGWFWLDVSCWVCCLLSFFVPRRRWLRATKNATKMIAAWIPICGDGGISDGDGSSGSGCNDSGGVDNGDSGGDGDYSSKCTHEGATLSNGIEYKVGWQLSRTPYWWWRALAGGAPAKSNYKNFAQSVHWTEPWHPGEWDVRDRVGRGGMGCVKAWDSSERGCEGEGWCQR